MNKDLAPGALTKPKRGSSILARAAQDAERKANEKAVAALVKARDGRCRWPEKHVCRGGPLEAAHIRDKSLRGGTTTEVEVTLCPWIHRRGPESIHGKQLKIEAETAHGANGPLSFHRQSGEFDALGQPIYYCIAREQSVGIVERD